MRGNKIHLHGGVNVSRTLEETLAGQILLRASVHLTEMRRRDDVPRPPTRAKLINVGAKNDVKVTNARGNHPNGVYAYRIEHEGKSIVYITDSGVYAIVDPKLKKLAMNADVLIFDAMYTPEEYSGEVGGGPKTGWGHATFVAGCELATAAKVKQLVLHHHDPGQSDAAVRDKERRAKELFPNTVAAKEGSVIEL